MNPVSVYLFHEMLHWFHCLKDQDRYFKERVTYLNFKNLTVPPLLRYYFGETYKRASCDGSAEILGKNSFGNRSEYDKICIHDGTIIGEFCVDVEEMRTILGSDEEVSDFKNGDDLSENLYSCSLGITRNDCNLSKMRYGHALRIIGTQHSDQIKKALYVVKNNIEKIHGKQDNLDALFVLDGTNVKDFSIILEKRFERNFETIRQIMNNIGQKHQMNPFERIEYEKK